MDVLNANLGADFGVELNVRIGVNSGEALVSDSGAGESFATGNAVNVAMRLEQAAAPGEIRIGAATYGLVRDAVEAEAADESREQWPDAWHQARRKSLRRWM